MSPTTFTVASAETPVNVPPKVVLFVNNSVNSNCKSGVLHTVIGPVTSEPSTSLTKTIV